MTIWNASPNKLATRNLRGRARVVAPVWPPTGGGSAMGSEAEREPIPDAGQKSMRHRAKAARDRHPVATGSCASIPPSSPAEWAKDPLGNTKQIAETFREACTIAEELWRAAGRGRRNLLGRNA